MAKEINNQPQRPMFQQQQTPQMQPRQEQPRFIFRGSWMGIAIGILIMWYLLKNIKPVINWNQITDLMSVKNTEQYAMLAILCIVIIFVVAIARILGRKKD